MQLLEEVHKLLLAAPARTPVEWNILSSSVAGTQHLPHQAKVHYLAVRTETEFRQAGSQPAQAIESSLALAAFQAKVADELVPAVATPYSAFEQYGAVPQCRVEVQSTTNT